MKNCPTLIQWQALLADHLAGPVAEEMATHLDGCAACQKALDEMASSAEPDWSLLQNADSTPASLFAGDLIRAIPAPAALADRTGVTLARQPKVDVARLLSPPQAPGEIGRLGEYRVLRELGQGGMGAVLLAEDPQLERLVALKVMLPSLSSGVEGRRRFLREARAAAAIQHDHVVPIFAVSEVQVEGVGALPYLSMPFLQGEPLDVCLARERRLPVGEVLRIGRELALGLAAAHEKGLVHRDIKPANVWLEGKAQRVKILDFGLARAAGQSETWTASTLADTPLPHRGVTEQLTQTGSIVGTPAYMAPEQVEGKPTGQRSDLFGLGVVLYEMCTGVSPFRDSNPMNTLLAVSTRQPRPPRDLRPDLPGALSNLVMQLLAKMPQQRPPSAQAVADQLEGIRQSTDGRSLRRKVLWLALPAALLAVVMAGLVAAFGLWQAASTVEVVSEASLPVKVFIEGEAGSAALDPVERPRAALPPGMYRVTLGKGSEGLRLDPDAFVLPRGGRQVIHVRPEVFRQPAFAELSRRASPLDTRRLLDIPADARANLGSWVGPPPPELVAVLGEPRFRMDSFASWPAFSPDGKSLAVGDGYYVVVFDVATGRCRLRLAGHGTLIGTLAFSPDGKQLASTSGDGTVRLWDAQTGRPAATLPGHVSGIFTVAWAPGGSGPGPGVKLDPNSLWTADGAGFLRSWPANALRPDATWQGHQSGTRVAFSPDGQLAASAGRDQKIHIWDSKSRALLRTLACGAVGLQLTAVFSPDGKYLAGGTMGQLRLWDAKTWAEVLDLRVHAAFLAFSPDSRTLWAADHSPGIKPDHLARRIEVPTGKELPPLKLHTRGIVTCFALSADGRTLAEVDSQDCYVYLHDTATGKVRFSDPGHTLSIYAAVFHPDGKHLASAGGDHTIRIWDLASGKTLRTLTGHKGTVSSLAFSPDGRSLVSASDDRTLRFWDFATGKTRSILAEHESGVSCAVFSPDGQMLASGSIDTMIHLWNVRTGEVVRTLRGHTGTVHGVAFSPDGKLLASASADSTIRIWDLARGEQLCVLPEAEQPQSVRFLPDGRTVAASSWMWTGINLWDWKSGKKRTLIGTEGLTREVTVRPDGRFLATGSHDGTVRLWDLHQSPITNHQSPPRRKTFRVLPSGGWVYGVSFSPEGRHLAAAGCDGLIYILKVPDTLPAEEPGILHVMPGHSLLVHNVVIPPGTRHAVTASQDGSVRRWDLKTGKPAAVCPSVPRGCTCLALNEDGWQSAAGFADGAVRLWDFRDGRPLWTSAGHRGEVSAIALSAQGTRCASGGHDGAVCLWDLGGALLKTFRDHKGRVTMVALSPDGRKVISGSQDKTACCYDAETGQRLHTFAGYSGLESRMCFTPDGRHVVWGHEDGSIRIHDTQTGKEVQRLAYGDPGLTGLAFTGEGKRLMAGSGVAPLMMWEWRTGQVLQRRRSGTGVTQLALTPDGRRLVTAHGDHQIRVWVWE